MADGLAQSDLNPPQPFMKEFFQSEVEEMSALLRHCQLKLMRMSESLNINQTGVQDVNDKPQDMLFTSDSDSENSNKCQNPTAAVLTPSDTWVVKDEILIPSDCPTITIERENLNGHSEIETSSCISVEFIAAKSSKNSDKTDDNLSDSRVDFADPLECMNDVPASEEETEVEQSCDGIRTSCRKTLKMTELDFETITIRPRLTFRKR